MTLRVYCSLFLFACGVAHAQAQSTRSPLAFAQVRDGSRPVAMIDLGGAWKFKATDESQWMPAHVPSTVQTDLLGAGRIPDPFYRDNELKVQWVERKEWEYRRRFQVDAALLAHDRVLLECRGLDTIAEIHVNGRLLAKTINMFIEHEFDVKPFLRPGENEIHIVFGSILNWVRQQVDADPRAATLCPEGDTRADCGKGNAFVARKEASDFGWNWGLRLLTSGIWKPIRITAYDVARVANLLVTPDLSVANRATLEVSADIDRFGNKDPLTLDLTVMLDGRIVTTRSVRVQGSSASTRLQITNPTLWWPRGWGPQALYTIDARLMRHGSVVHTRSLRTGLRTVELIREKDAQGETFGFRVNGKSLFARGANWIPADALPDRLTEAHYRSLLQSAVDANLNMLRVWGGGLYESDVFYEFCDENGILIWQDFMFAVGPYLAVPSYLENVRAEVENVVRRRRHHPSIVLWCGNNEQESNMTGSGQNWVEKYPVVSWKDYDAVFHELIPQTVGKLDSTRPYWPSSPHHPLDREKKTPNWESASGDVHDWSVWHGTRPISALNTLGQFRFVSEFGFAGPPAMETIRSFTLPEDRSLNSYVMDLHDKEGSAIRSSVIEMGHNRSAARITRHLAAHFILPTRFEDWVYLAQVLQAEAIRIGSEAARRAFPSCTGALYWQLNDNWPTLSKASLDYCGRWKALHYAARRFFVPVLASAVVDGTSVSITGVNDRLVPVTARLEWTLARLDGAVVRRGGREVTLAPTSSRLLEQIEFDEVAEPPGERTYRNDSFSRAGQFYFTYRLVSGGEELSANVAFFAPYKYLNLPQPDLQWQIAPSGREVRIHARRFAAFVELSGEGDVHFTDNYFHMLPGESRTVAIRSTGDVKKVFARSLVDTMPISTVAYGGVRID